MESVQGLGANFPKIIVGSLIEVLVRDQMIGADGQDSWLCALSKIYKTPVFLEIRNKLVLNRPEYGPAFDRAILKATRAFLGKEKVKGLGSKSKNHTDNKPNNPEQHFLELLCKFDETIRSLESARDPGDSIHKMSKLKKSVLREAVKVKANILENSTQAFKLLQVAHDELAIIFGKEKYGNTGQYCTKRVIQEVYSTLKDEGFNVNDNLDRWLRRINHS